MRKAMLGLAVAAGALALSALGPGDGELGVPGLPMAVAALGLLALWFVFRALTRHVRALERLSAALEGRGAFVAPAGVNPAGDGELARVWAAIARRLGREGHGRGGGRDGERLRVILGLIDAPLLVVTDDGRIEALSAAARPHLGMAAVEGRDVGAVFQRGDFVRALERARAAGRTVTARLKGVDGVERAVHIAELGVKGGAVIVVKPPPSLLATEEAAAARGAGTRAGFPAGTALGALPMVALWVAGTGPVEGEGKDGGSGDARAIAVGTVRLSGARIFRTVSLDVLIDPERPIPPSAEADHGITTAMVAGERFFAEVWPVIAQALGHAVVVGFGVEAGLALLAREVGRAGLPAFPVPDVLELAPLARVVGLEPPTTPPRPPLALPTAELAALILRRLEDQGVTTLAQAQALSSNAASGLV